MWTSEEFGGAGSIGLILFPFSFPFLLSNLKKKKKKKKKKKAYYEAHKDELDKTVFALESDIGTLTPVQWDFQVKKEKK